MSDNARKVVPLFGISNADPVGELIGNAKILENAGVVIIKLFDTNDGQSFLSVLKDETLQGVSLRAEFAGPWATVHQTPFQKEEK